MVRVALQVMFVVLLVRPTLAQESPPAEVATAVEARWAEGQRQKLREEVQAQLGDIVTHADLLGLEAGQRELLAAGQRELTAQIEATLRQAWERQRERIREVLGPGQWRGFDSLPAIQRMSPGELQPLLELTAEQVQRLERIEGRAKDELQEARKGALRDAGRAWFREVLDGSQRRLLGARRRVDNLARGRRQRVAELLGGEAAAVLIPLADPILTLDRELEWERELLAERLRRADDARVARLLTGFRERQVLAAEERRRLQGPLLEQAGPLEQARLVALGLLD